MFSDAAILFEDKKKMLKKLKKPVYEENYKNFKTKYQGDFYDWMLELNKSEDKEGCAEGMAGMFVNQVRDKFSKNGKIGGAEQFDLNLFMVYYIFPNILQCELGESRLMCDKLCEAWSRCFKHSKIGYMDYDKIYSSFNDKILGLFKPPF